MPSVWALPRVVPVDGRALFESVSCLKIENLAINVSLTVRNQTVSVGHVVIQLGTV